MGGTKYPCVLRAELHSHSSLSHDGRDPIELILGQAAAVGLDALAITDHDAVEASKAAAEKASKYGLIGVPGIEVSSQAGHILGIGVTELIPKGRSFEETIELIHEAGGIAILPHPFQKSRHGVGPNVPPDVLAMADAIEVYNSRLLTGRGNRQARQFAETYNMPMTAGSDAHISEMVGQAVTAIDTTDRSVNGIVNAIREGRTTIEGSRTPWRISLRQAAGGAKRRVISRIKDSFT